MFNSRPCDWSVFPAASESNNNFSVDHKRRSRKRNWKKWKCSDSSDSDSVELTYMYDSVSDPDFRFSQGHKRSYESDTIPTPKVSSHQKMSGVSSYVAKCHFLRMRQKRKWWHQWIFPLNKSLCIKRKICLGTRFIEWFCIKSHKELTLKDEPSSCIPGEKWIVSKRSAQVMMPSKSLIAKC